MPKTRASSRKLRPPFVQLVFEPGDALLALRSVNIGEPPVAVEFARDPKDEPFLAAALATRADFLVTGDKDLLEARDAVETRILTVVEACTEFGIV